jgi:hypothetical protein
VSGNTIQDPSGATIVLRGVAIPDIGTLATKGNGAYGADGITARIDEILAGEQLDAHVIRFPVYPRTVPNSNSPYYSPLPYPVGPAAPTDGGLNAPATVINVTAQDYIAKVLQPAVDYATSKNLYVIVDYHQIDNTTGQSGTDAVTFWTQVAPVFSQYPNVIYEAFNEPIDSAGGGWTSAYQTQAQAWINAIRSGAPNNLIIVGSPNWSQYPGGAAQYPLTGGNLAFSAHIYPGNWNTTFQARVTAAVANVPVFITEWGYDLVANKPSFLDPNYNLETNTETWVQNLETYVNGNGASWTAWVADPAWGPPMFSNDGGLTDFGGAVQSWLASEVDAGWVH